MEHRKKTDLKNYSTGDYHPDYPAPLRALWYLVSIVIFQSSIVPFYGLKSFVLKLFGAKVGAGLVVKPKVNIKYPWKLTIGDYCWIGENVWIDNLTHVNLGSHSCLSQGAMLLTGNHNYQKIGFDLIVKPIILEDGVWIGARATVCPGVTCFSHSVLTAGSIASKDLEAYGIYAGSPAVKIRERIIA